MSEASGYRRVIVKLSGEALAGPARFGVDQQSVDRIAADLSAARARGVVLGVVVGGGNFFRGIEVAEGGPDRPTADTVGMLATVMNALLLEAALKRAGAPATTLTALFMPGVCEGYSRNRALEHLANGRIILLAAGTGNPFFTTDTAAVLRASELGCDAVLKATNVDGVYDADPKKQANARRLSRLSHQQALAQDLKIMDATAFALARDNRMPIIVFSIREPGAIVAALSDRGRVTIVG